MLPHRIHSLKFSAAPLAYFGLPCCGQHHGNSSHASGFRATGRPHSASPPRSESRRKPSSALEVVARQAQFANLTLGENEAANTVLGGFETLKAQVFGWALCFLWLLR